MQSRDATHANILTVKLWNPMALSFKPRIIPEQLKKGPIQNTTDDLLSLNMDIPSANDGHGRLAGL